MVQRLGEISSWIRNSWLKANLSKAEVVLVGIGQYFEEFAAAVQSPLVKVMHPQFVTLVHNLGVCLDSLLTLSFHIRASMRNAFYHLCWLEDCPIMVDDDLASIMHAFIIYWLNYSNMIYLGRKPAAVRKRQLVQNAAASLLSNTGYSLNKSNLSSALYTGFS